MGKHTISCFLSCFVFYLGSMAAAGTEAALSANPQAEYAGTVQARAVLTPTSGSHVHGFVTFRETSKGVLVIASARGLSPGPHGFHIHEFGDCSASDGSSAGGHFNPDNKVHGAPEGLERHAGDLGNIIADPNGRARYQRIDSLIQLSGPKSIIGKSIIIHEHSDDFKTQPTGNAGSRLSCGVIVEKTQAKTKE